MGAVPRYDAGSAGPERLAVGCGFPTCEHESVTEQGMCELHRRVVISRTGSWLEAS